MYSLTSHRLLPSPPNPFTNPINYNHIFSLCTFGVNCLCGRHGFGETVPFAVSELILALENTSSISRNISSCFSEILFKRIHLVFSAEMELLSSEKIRQNHCCLPQKDQAVRTMS